MMLHRDDTQHIFLFNVFEFNLNLYSAAVVTHEQSLVLILQMPSPTAADCPLETRGASGTCFGFSRDFFTLSKFESYQ